MQNNKKHTLCERVIDRDFILQAIYNIKDDREVSIKRRDILYRVYMGEKYTDIAEIYNVSKQRIEQIVKAVIPRNEFKTKVEDATNKIKEDIQTMRMQGKSANEISEHVGLKTNAINIMNRGIKRGIPHQKMNKIKRIVDYIKATNCTTNEAAKIFGMKERSLQAYIQRNYGKTLTEVRGKRYKQRSRRGEAYIWHRELRNDIINGYSMEELSAKYNTTENFITNIRIKECCKICKAEKMLSIELEEEHNG